MGRKWCVAPAAEPMDEDRVDGACWMERMGSSIRMRPWRWTLPSMRVRGVGGGLADSSARSRRGRFWASSFIWGNVRASGGRWVSAASGYSDGRAPTRRAIDPYLEEALAPPVPVGALVSQRGCASTEGGRTRERRQPCSALSGAVPWSSESMEPELC